MLADSATSGTAVVRKASACLVRVSRVSAAVAPIVASLGGVRASHAATLTNSGSQCRASGRSVVVLAEAAPPIVALILTVTNHIALLALIVEIRGASPLVVSDLAHPTPRRTLTAVLVFVTIVATTSAQPAFSGVSATALVTSQGSTTMVHLRG